MFDYLVLKIINFERDQAGSVLYELFRIIDAEFRIKASNVIRTFNLVYYEPFIYLKP